MVQNLLAELHRRGVKLRLTGDRLDVLAAAGTLTPALREELTARRDELIALLQAGGGGDLVQAEPQPGQWHDPFPLTDIQHAYWVGRNPSVELGGVATHYYFELDSQDLDLPRLNESLRQVIRRHDMLRAVIQPDGRQRVLPEVPPYQIAVADLRGRLEAERDAELARIRASLEDKVLPADRWPLFEIQASRLTDLRLVLHISIDLLIADGFSLYLMFEDWRRFYTDPGWRPEPLPFRFRDYVMAEESLRRGRQYQAAEEYWLGRLDSLPAAPALPKATLPALLTRPRFCRLRAELARPQWEAIKQHARRHELTPSVVLMTAFAEVLRLWSEQSDFTLNLSLFNRPTLHPRIGEVIGDFTSVMLFAATAVPGEPFAGRARRLQQQFMRDLGHLAYSGVRVMRERSRRLGGGPTATMPIVFTSVVALSPGGAEHAAGTGLFGGRGFFGAFRYGVSQTPQVALDHQVAEEQGVLYFNWDAVPAVFPPSLLDDMFAAYCGMLTRLSEDAGYWDRQVALVTLPRWQAAERGQANDTAAPVPARTLCELVGERAAGQPEAVAVIAHDGQLSYRETAGQAYRLARHLAGLGAVRNSLVAVVMDRGKDQVAAVLGITASGAAYLPIDPDWPDARRWALFEQGRVRLAVTTPALRERLSWPPDVSPVTFGDAAVSEAGEAAPVGGPVPGDLAYVIFTSGSTGQPKGVMIDHRGAVNTITDINRRFQVGPADRVLALSSLSFDLSVYDIFGTLAAGGTVIMPSPAGAQDPGHWGSLMKQHGVTVWNSVPALMQAWLEASGPSVPGHRALRLVMLSGDWIPVTQPDAIRALHPQARVVSLGGATEASIWSVWYPIETVSPEWTSIPYGKPLANQTLHVYREGLEPCPVWTAGEIYIGGTGVALGYWDDAERTAERFVVHPATGERLYRTGDLGRYLPGGDIEFLGRTDSQVKLNGHRIELGEIAAALQRQPGVRDALISVDANPATGRRQLVAHVVPDGSRGGEPGEASGPDRAKTWQTLVGTGEDERAAGAAARRADLAAYRSLLDRFNAISAPLMAQTLARLGYFTADGAAASAAQIVEDSGIKLRYRWLIDQWMALLAGAGVLSPAGREGEYRCDRALDERELDRQVRDGLARFPGEGPHSVLAGYFASCAGHQAELLRGEVNVREYLLPGGSWEVTEAMYASNPLAYLQNRVVAEIIRSFVTGHPAGRVRILEVGAGTGATTGEVLPVLPAGRCHYSFTDVSFFFTERARAKFAAHPCVEYRTLDVDRDPATQGFAPGSADVIIAANVLHNSRHLDRTLRYLRSTLSSGGLLTLVENTVNEAFHLVTVGFYQDVGCYEDERVLPLLSPEGWRERLTGAGFPRFGAIPGDGGGDPLGQHIIMAEAPPGRTFLDAAGLRAALDKLLPGYMVPQHYLFISQFPLTANGKLDRSALPVPWTVGGQHEPAPPSTEAERALLEIWREVLARDDFGVADNIFELGGDSLHALQIIGRLRDELGMQVNADEGLQILFDHPTIAALASALSPGAGS